MFNPDLQNTYKIPPRGGLNPSGMNLGWQGRNKSLSPFSHIEPALMTLWWSVIGEKWNLVILFTGAEKQAITTSWNLGYLIILHK